LKKLVYGLRCALCAFLCMLLMGGYFSPRIQAILQLPSTYYLEEGSQKMLPGLSEGDITIEKGAAVRLSTDESIREKSGVVLESVEQGKSSATLRLFGIPVRSIELRVLAQKALIPGGQPVGIRLYTQGALVVGTSEVISPDGTAGSPAQEAGLKTGDVILSINGIALESSDHLGELVNEAQGAVRVHFLREGNVYDLNILPRIDAQDGQKRLGLWARDSTAGVGTLTFCDPESGLFGALGHAITDVDTHTNLTLRKGELVAAEVVDVKAGVRGEPGELKGVFSQGEQLGAIAANTDYGIYGTLNQIPENPLYPSGVEIALRNEVHLGRAEILATVDDQGIRSYECQIIRLTPQATAAPRGIVVEVTDRELLEKTGGIVQGMSGSPILQDGKLVGAVTHVFVNDASKGYGMYIEWMLEAAG